MNLKKKIFFEHKMASEIGKENRERMQRVLSIQSHVVRGKCGNASAAFPLGECGFCLFSRENDEFKSSLGWRWTD